MSWQTRKNGIVRFVVDVVDGAALGIIAGALYAGLVAAVYLSVSPRWERLLSLTVTSLLAGAFFGLLGGIVWALLDRLPAADRARDKEDGQWLETSRTAPRDVPARQSAQRSADERGEAVARRPVQAGYRADHGFGQASRARQCPPLQAL